MRRLDCPYPEKKTLTTDGSEGVSRAAYGIAIGLLILVAVAARFAALDRLELNKDEAHSVLTAISSQNLFAALRNDTNPPLYFLMLKLWIGLFGFGPLAVRTLSVLFSVGAVAALAALLRECSSSRWAVLWVLLLAALSPLHILYAQTARGYAMGELLVTLGMLTFMRCVHRPRPVNWMLHGLTVAAGCYTHDLILPLTVGYWIAAGLMRLPWRQWRGLALSHGFAAVLAMPVILLSLNQETSSGGLQWIRKYWEATPPVLCMPKSLDVLGFGGGMPAYMAVPPLSLPLHVLSLALALASLVGVWLLIRGASRQTSRQGIRIVSLLVAFVLWPLAFLFVFSLLKTPIYLVGRYDILAQPAFLGLLALGLARFQAYVSQRSQWTAVLPAIAGSVVLIAGVWGYWTYPLSPLQNIHRDRAAYLAQSGSENDPIICTGLETSSTRYYLMLDHRTNPLFTFPGQTLTHIGWFISDGDIVAHQDAWPAEAQRCLHEAEQAGSQRIWIFCDLAAPFVPGSPRAQLQTLLLESAAGDGLVPAAADSAHRGDESDLEIISLRSSKAGT